MQSSPFYAILPEITIGTLGVEMRAAIQRSFKALSVAIRRGLLNISDGVVIGILVGFFAGAVRVSLVAYGKGDHTALWEWIDGFAQNFGTEMFGAFMTFFLIETLLGRKDTLRKMGSRVNDLVLDSIDIFLREGWLRDGTLKGARLTYANLQGAGPSGANLEGVSLSQANLQGINLVDANLQGADLANSNLQGANLWEANLRGAVLYDANLQGANLGNAKFSKETMLPDLTRWTYGVDISRFTTPDHAEFWRSDNVTSPAYRGADDPNDPELQRVRGMLGWPTSKE